MTKLFLSQHIGICALLLSLGLSEIVGLSGENNETRNGSLPVLLNDQGSYEERGCIDWQGNSVKDGEKYVPDKTDVCMRCTCRRRFPVICNSVACSPPLDCTNAQLVSGTCCEYECLGDTGRNVTDTGNTPSSDNTESITNLSLRLIASTVTSLLFLALLLFMVHRLRQRRMLMAMRRFQARSDNFISDDMDGDCNTPDNFMSLECPPYTDPPPPYSPPKPPHILPGEQPPAYDEISIAENANRESRSGSQEERNSHEARVVSESNPVTVRDQLHRELNQTNAFHQIYSSPQTPTFGVEMEMPRSPVLSQDTALNQNDNILPAYASTDILFRNATFSTMVTPPHRQADSSDNSTQLSNTSINGSNTSRVEATGMPTLTAFQRFSSLFKRDKSKYKNRSNQQRRPVSEFVPPHYATLSRTHHILTVLNPDDDQSSRADNHDLSNVTYRNNSNRNGGSRARSCYPNLNLTDRMRLSYDSARAAYELAALSPSTSSNSSISMEQLPAQDGSITTSCVPSSTTYSTDALPSSQSSTHHSQESVPVLVKQQVDNINSHSYNSSTLNHSTTHSLPAGSNIRHPPHQTSGEFNMYPPPHSPSKFLNDGARCSPEQNSSSHCNNVRNTPPSSQKCFNRNTRCVETEQPDYRENNNLDGNHRNRIRNFNPNANNHSAVLHHETSKHGAHPITVEATDHPGTYPPSPLPALGQMRRSHSSTSQVSAFSVCSETGEKKMKDDKRESDNTSKPLPSDCQYPPHPPSLSHPYNKPLKNIPHSNASIFRGHTNPPPIRRGGAPIPVTSTTILDPDLQPATLIVPVTAHLSLTGDKPIPSQNKKFRQKDLHIDLQPFDDDNVSSTAVQSSPISPPFVTVQSGKLISNPPPPAPAVEWTAGRDIVDSSGKLCHDNIDENKKYRKKTEKDKRVTSLSFKPKDVSGSPSHMFKDVVKTKYDLGNVKNKHSRHSSAKGVSSRKGDKKRVQHFQPSTSSVMDNSILPDFEEFSTSYGNADVYRSQVCDPSSSSSFHVLSSPFHKFVDNNQDSVQLSKDCGQQDAKRGHTFSSPKAAVPDFVPIGYNNNPSSSRHLQQTSLGTVKYPSPQSRKKPGHKRQASSGNRNLNAQGPSSTGQKQNRSKSLTTTGKMQDCDPVTNDTAFEQVISDGRWVKSGFGHDLAFDDQSGGIDMGMSDRAMDQHYPYNSSFKTTRGECNNVSKNFDAAHGVHGSESKVATASVVPLPTRRRSGLSQDLSFVNRSEVNPNPTKRLNKRSSLPGFLTFTNQQSQKSYGDPSDYVVSGNLQQQETEMPQKQLKNSKERRDRSNPHDKSGRLTATSYV